MEKRDGADPYFKVCKGLKDITAKAEVLCHNFEIDLKKMISAQPRFKYCGEEFLQRGNLELIRCTDIDEARRGMVEAMLAGGDELMRSLSPFDGTVQNKDNSLFLIDKKKDEVIGWVICRDKEEGCIEIARLYVISDGRRKATGVFFAGYMLRRLASSYDRGVAKVMADNRPMLAFIRNVFSESIRESSDKRMVLTWR